MGLRQFWSSWQLEAFLFPLRFDLNHWRLFFKTIVLLIILILLVKVSNFDAKRWVMATSHSLLIAFSSAHCYRLLCFNNRFAHFSRRILKVLVKDVFIIFLLFRLLSLRDFSLKKWPRKHLQLVCRLPQCQWCEVFNLIDRLKLVNWVVLIPSYRLSLKQLAFLR